MVEAVIGLGSNLGSRHALLAAAAAMLDAAPGCQVLARSGLYGTPPLGPPQPDYLNAALRVAWVGSAQGLLDLILGVEQHLGRVRAERWGARTLDLDLLWWQGRPVATPRLSLPHPELERRAFALAPLLDVAPELTDRYGACLARQPSLPPPRPWLDLAQPLQAGRWAEFDQEAEAVAAAATALGRQLAPRASAIKALAWDPTPDGGDLGAALQQVVRAAGWGFEVAAAVVTAGDNKGGRWAGRLLGSYVPPQPMHGQVRVRGTLKATAGAPQVHVILSLFA